MVKPFIALALAVSFACLAALTRAEDSCYQYRFSFRHDDIVTCAAFSADGRWLATGSEAGTVIATDTQTRQEFTVKNPASQDNGVQALCYSPDGKLLFVGGYGNKNGGGEIKVIRTSDYSAVDSFDTSGGVVDFLKVSSDGKWVISGDGRKMRIWNIEKKSAGTTLSLADSTLDFDADRTLFVGVGKLDPGATLETTPPGPPADTALAPGQIVLFDIVENKVARIFRTLPEEPVRRIVVSRAKKELFVLTESGTVYRLDRNSGEIKQRIALAELALGGKKEKLEVNRRNDFDVLEAQPIFVFNDRTHTLFMNYETKKIVPLNHQSMVGIQMNPTGKGFALLGGVKMGALTGVPEQHYWTVNIFGFKPF